MLAAQEEAREAKARERAAESARLAAVEEQAKAFEITRERMRIQLGPLETAKE
jgi:hypothetical protein